MRRAPPIFVREEDVYEKEKKFCLAAAAATASAGLVALPGSGKTRKTQMEVEPVGVNPVSGAGGCFLYCSQVERVSRVLRVDGFKPASRCNSIVGSEKNDGPAAPIRVKGRQT